MMYYDEYYHFQMFGSKINELNQSTFRDHPNNAKPSGFKPRVASILLGNDGKELQTMDLREQLKDYLVDLPPCAYHHQPIKYLCLSPTCTSSTYSLCEHPACRSLHSNPDTDLIEIDSFNSFLASNCSSLLLLAKKVRTYLLQLRQRLLLEADKAIEKTAYIFQNIYMGDIPRKVRRKAYKDITSAQLFHFIKHESFQNNLHQRSQMESLRNEVAARIAELDRNFEKLAASKDFQALTMLDVVRFAESSPLALMGKVDVDQFDSRVLEYKEDFEDVFRLLKENRAPAFKAISTLFRASEHGFSAEEYHRVVDGKAPTLLLVKTSLGKRFGAFLNCKVDQKQEWIPDATGLSFILSLDRKETYKLKPEAKCRLRAAFGGSEGPQVGSGCDLYLVDGCNTRKGSGANLGGSYRLPNYLEHNTAKSRIYLAGEQSFLVEEYEVFLLE